MHKSSTSTLKRTLLTTLTLLAVIFTALGVYQSVQALNPPALQTFYVTLPEEVMLQYFHDMFLAAPVPVSPIRSITSIAIGTSGTEVYYDQWEDGSYDADIANPNGNYYDASSNTDGTQIWGDGVLVNGCVPFINNLPNPCKQPSDDRLVRGNTITLDNWVTVNGASGSYTRSAAEIFYDGRDKIGASMPVAVTRTIWPSGTGSLVADAQTILPTENWGATYYSPVGETVLASGSFDDVRMLIMAGAGGSNISVDANADGDYLDTYDLNGVALTEGQVRSINGLAATTPDGVLAGAKVVVNSGNPVQVTLITSDYNSSYENRFYNLVPYFINPANPTNWASDYYSPVGTTTGASCTSNWIYNPNAAAITVSYDFPGGATPDGTRTINSKTNLEMPAVPLGNGVRYYTSGSVFLPISTTDCYNGGTGGGTGDIYDWGNELYPLKQLSPELLMGYALGCSNESYYGICLDDSNTGRTTSRSVVWLTPLANTTIYVDTNGSGIDCTNPAAGAEKTIAATALGSYQVNDDPTSRTYVHDNFTTAAYNRVSDNIGFGLTPGVWATNWTESGDDNSPTAGMIYVNLTGGSSGGGLQFRDLGGNETNVSIQRSRNLASQKFSRLSFRIAFAGSFQSDDAIAVEISSNGGSTWNTLETISGPISYATGQSANKVYITSAYNSANTTIRFRTIGNLEANETWSIDEVHLDNAPDGDFDMTGSYIRTCNDVQLAAAFGQNPALSFSGDDEAMDMGMAVQPYGSQIKLTKSANVDYVSPGDLVTYSYTVRLLQTFSVSVNDVSVEDDSCSPITYVSGDANTNTLLDPGEIFNFTCSTRLYTETTNTAVAYALYGTDRIRSAPAQDIVKLNSSLGDTVWVDEDGDGDQDAGEPGIPNVKVTLAGTDMAGNAVSRTTYTDADGHYIFKNVVPSNASGYTVTVDSTTLPAGLAANPTYDENGVGTPNVTTVVLGSDLEYTTADFGYNWSSITETNTNTGTGMIGDRIWSDANGDGIQNPGEPGLYNVTVQRLTAGADGLFGTADDVIAGTTTTDYAGNYAFDGLAAGAYAIRVPTTPAGTTQTGDPDQPGTACTTCDGRTTTPIVLAPGDVYLNADFGFRPDASTGATIGDTLWVDANRNNVVDPGELPLPGISVSLIRDLNGDGTWNAGEPIIATTITNASGQYAFNGVPVADGVGSDDYLVWVNDTSTVLPELNPTYDSDGAAPATGVVTGLGISKVTDLAPAGNLLQDFAYAPPGHDAGEAMVGDTVWLDQNGNGTYEAGEGLEGVMVNLLNSSGKIIARTQTNENGQYFFGDLAAGNYTVDLNTNSLPNFGITLTNFVDPDGGLPNRAGFSLTSGQILLTEDFGYRNTSGYTIGGTLWNDTDTDGLLDAGEAGRYAGVTVALYTDSNDNGVWDAADLLVGTRTTDASGNYSFTGLPNDTYFVDVTDDANLLIGTWNSLGTAGLDSNGQLDPYKIVLAGANNTTADYGYYRDPASLGDFVWADTNRDGLQTSGETGISGATVTLTITWPTGGTTVLNTLTDANGNYRFGNLLLDEDFDGVGSPEPTYSVTFTAPTGYEPTTANVGGDDTIDSDGPTAAATAAKGVYNTTVDMGYRLTNLTITKSSSVGGYANPGDTITYSIVVTNNTSSRHTGIAITDTAPTGTTFVSGSSLASGYVLTPFNYTYADDFDPTPLTYSGNDGNHNFSAAWVESDGTQSPTLGNVQLISDLGDYSVRVGDNPAGNPNVADGSIYRVAGDLSVCTSVNLTYNYRRDSMEAADHVYLDMSLNGGSGWTNAVRDITNGADAAYVASGSIDITAYKANLALRFRSLYNEGGNAVGRNDRVYVDDVVITCTGTSINPVTNQAAHDAPNLVIAGDNFLLDPGQNMTVTFQATVSDPVSLTSIDNTASVVSAQQLTPQSASVSDLLPRATIGNSVWLDEDGNGYQDAGEAGIPNITVQLWNSGHTAVVDTTTTDANGNYNFKNVAPGTYQVDVLNTSLPIGLVQTTVIGGPADFTNKADPYTLTVVAGSESMQADFGFNWAPSADTDGNINTGAIGDRLWIDDGNGRQDPGEPGLYNVTVQLLTAGTDGIFGTGDDVIAASTTTNYAGNYVFDGLAAGAYAVRVPTVPSGYAQTGDPDQPGVVCTTCDNKTTTPILLAPGDVYVNADFGYQPTAGNRWNIGDTLWLDSNRNNAVDSGEPLLAGVSVALIRDLNENGTWDAGEPVIASDITDTSGSYLFTNVPVTVGVGTNDYLVWVNDTENVLFGLTPTFDSNGAGTPNISAVTNMGAANNLTQDFAYAPRGHDTGEGMIGDTIFYDNNNNGTYQTGEGLEGVRVELYRDVNNNNVWDSGDALLASTRSSENGSYYFGGLAAGEYVVRIGTTSLPTGVTNTVDPDTASPGDNQSAVTLAAGGINLTQDFGYRDTSNPNTISGTLWRDTDANGVLGGSEAGRFDGITMVLRNSSGNIIATTTTAGGGNFSFGNLPDGTYTVDVSDDANLLDGYWHSLGTAGSDNNSQVDPYTVTLSGNTNNTTADFGYYRDPASIGDFVWSDTNSNGIQDSGEPGLANVLVTLTVTYPNASVATLKTRTDANGLYSFGNLLADEDFDGVVPGEPTFQITVTAPSGYSATLTDQGGNDNLDSDGLVITAVPLEGSNNTSYDCGFVQSATISNFVWIDTNLNGIQDILETAGINNVTVNLRDSTGNTILQTTTTNASGIYSFSAAPGVYILEFITPSGYAHSPNDVGGDDSKDSDANSTSGRTGQITMTAGLNNDTVDAGFYALSPNATISDFVWIDTNANGIQDPGENGLNNVTVNLRDSSSGNILQTTSTNASGIYSFTTSPGFYIVEFITPGGYNHSPKDQGSDDAKDSDADTSSGRTVSITVIASEINNTVDAGFYQNAVISNFVWNDVNGNGIQESGEAGIDGATVQLWNSGHTIQLATTTTAGGGYYSFTTAPGTYVVDFLTPSGYTHSPQDQGNDALDSDANVSTGQTAPVTVISGQTDNSVDAGFYQSAQLSGYTYNDFNGNGSYDGGEGILTPVTVFLDTDNNGFLDSGEPFTNSNGSGYYEFTNLLPGSYHIREINPAGYSSTGDADGSGNGLDKIDRTLSAGQNSTGNNFLDWKPATISNFVWDDANANGIQDSGETTGINNVTVNLRDATGSTILQTTTTNASGLYSFTAQAGSYIVEFVTPTSGGYVHSPKDQTSDDKDSDPDVSTGKTDTITVAAGDNNDSVDAGFYRTATIGDFVWSDVDGDGIQESGEYGISGVTVNLLNSSGGFLQTTTTNASGNYSFTTAPGSYMLEFVALPGYVHTLQDQGGNDSLDSDASPTTSRTAIFALAEGDTNNTLDAGFVTPVGAIGDYVWLDEDSNGLQDAGEAGIPNVTVQLWNSAHTTLLATTTTDIEGKYLFPNIKPDNYVVTVVDFTLPNGLAANPTYDYDGTGTAHNAAVTVAPFQEMMSADFGYNWASFTDVTNPAPGATGVIGDRLWIDANSNGLQDSGEAGLAGVTITLFTRGTDGIFGTLDDVLVGTTSTDAAGLYIFEGLTADAYRVKVNGGAVPTGYTQTGDPDQPGTVCTTCDNITSTPILLGPGDVYVNADFGYQPAVQSNTIGNQIFLDSNGDGNLDGGEPGIPGVSVALLDGSNNVIATALTDVNGQYSFAGLPNGTYTVWVNDTYNVLGGLIQNSTPDNNVDGGQPCPTCNGRNTVVVGGTGNANQDFGFAPAGHAAGDGLIGDTIYLDRDGGNDYDTGEGLEGVKVQLFASDGTTLLATTYTSENGNYFFGNLNPTGIYVVKVDPGSLPAGVTNTIDPDGGTANQSTVNLATSGPIDLAQDFGYRDTSSPNTISGTIWNDTNADGTLSGEAGRFTGVTVMLLDNNGNIIATTITDGSGNYSFGNLPDGTYRVDVTDTSNVLNGYWHSTGPIPGNDDNSQADPYSVTVTGGQTNITADFGYYLTPATIGDYVWLDRNNNGIQDSDEPGIKGALVTLTVNYPNGDSSSFSELTGVGGVYSFGNLLLDETFRVSDGTSGTPKYSLSFATPAGTTPSPTGQGTIATDSNGASFVAAPITRGQTDITYDSGFYTLRLDLGDLPQTLYPTNFRPGPAHVLFPDGGDNIPDTFGGVPAVWLGTIVDAEPNGQPSTYANGDDNNLSDDEDGLTMADSGWNPGGINTGMVTLNASVSHTTVYFGLWIDWDNNGSLENFYSGSGETGSPVDVPVTINVPSNYVAFSTVYVRVRASSAPLTDADYEGTLINGEVEDYWYKFGPTAVNLLSFTATAAEKSIILNWETTNEIDNLGFNLYRATSVDGERIKLNTEMIPSGVYPGSPEGAVYNYTDTDIAEKTSYYYWLEDVDLHGAAKLHGPVVVVPTQVPPTTAFVLKSFTATGAKNSMLLKWETTSETGNQGFTVYRATSIDGSRTRLNAKLIPSLGASGGAYSYTDKTTRKNQTYYYWLEAVDKSGIKTLNGPVNAKAK